MKKQNEAGQDMAELAAKKKSLVEGLTKAINELSEGKIEDHTLVFIMGGKEGITAATHGNPMKASELVAQVLMQDGGLAKILKMGANMNDFHQAMNGGGDNPMKDFLKELSESEGKSDMEAAISKHLQSAGMLTPEEIAEVMND